MNFDPADFPDQRDSPAEPGTAESRPAAPTVQAADDGIVRCSHRAMATIYQIFIAHANEQYARQAAMHCFALLEELEQDLSRFRRNSDISRLNHARQDQVVAVSWAARNCLEIAQHLHACSDGAFDPSKGTGMDALEIFPEEPAVRIRRAGVQLDLGAIGKGFAVDCLAAALREWDLPCALIHGGKSSVLTLAPPPGRAGWTLTLNRPTPPEEALQRLDSSWQAIGGSGITTKGAHILNPRSGEPATAVTAAWVWGSAPPAETQDAVPGESILQHLRDGSRLSATEADALSTAMMNLSVEEMDRLQEHYPGLNALVRLPDGSVHRLAERATRQGKSPGC